MSAITPEIRKTVLSLPENERVSLAGDLLRSVPGGLAESLEEASSAWDTEIHARIAQIDSGDVVSIPAAEVFAKIDQNHGW